MPAAMDQFSPDALTGARCALAEGIDFAMPDLFGWMEAAAPADLDTLPFGLIAMAPDGTVEHYNLAEARISGLAPARVVGRHFFTSVAPCTNNAMIAHRFQQEPAIDATLDYIFTFAMVPQRVRVRLLKQPGARWMYLAVIRRP